MGNQTRISLLSLGLVLGAVPPAIAANPPANPAAQAPAAEEAISEAEQSLLLQLSDAEANIKALNLALARTGYKVGQAYSHIDSNLKGNEQMDRKGGGPVGWQDFYGKTARSFYIPDSEATVHSTGIGRQTDIHITQGNHPIQRPSQFDRIYKANNDQIARAKQEVAALAQDQATLLARRQKHEADQSRLWAMLAFERITDREIADEPLCRFRLKSGTGASDPRLQLLRAFVLFLRTGDRVAADGLEAVKADQAAAFGDLDARMKEAYASLRASLADAVLSSDLKPDDKKQADSLKALCKQLADEALVVADNYRNALDRDQAKEDNSKLVFREKLQESLAKFAATTAEFDVQVANGAKAWSISPEKGVPSSDELPKAIVRRPEPAPQAPIPPPPQQIAPPPAAQADPVQIGTVWRDNFQKLTILERQGDRVRARFDVGPRIVRIVSATVADGRFFWLSRDVEAVKGGVGGDNTATLSGDQMDFQWHDANGKSGTFVLRLEKSSVPRQPPDSLPNSAAARTVDPTAPLVPPDRAAAGHRRVDLLKLIDPSKNVGRGHWIMNGGMLSCDPVPDSFIEIPYVPPEEYDYKIEFVRTRGREYVGMVCFAGGRRFLWMLGGWGNRVAGFSFINGANANANRTTKTSSSWITNGHKYTMLIKVRRDGVEAYLDGDLVSQLKTNYRDVNLPRFQFSRPDTLGIGVFASAATIGSAEVVEITGQGKIPAMNQ